MNMQNGELNQFCNVFIHFNKESMSRSFVIGVSCDLNKVNVHVKFFFSFQLVFVVKG